MPTPNGTCPDANVRWKCDMSPIFSTLDAETRTIHVNCPGHWRVNYIDRTEEEQLVSRGSYRNPPKWHYYQGYQQITMETEYADVVCKGKRNRNMHNYHTQFLPKPDADKRQETLLHTVQAKEPNWNPLSVLTIVLDSLSRAHAHRECGIPKTIRLLEQLYDASSADPSLSSHQAFLFNRYNSISSATSLNLTPMFSGELYDEPDPDKITQGIYAKDIKEWIWEYANHRGYLTSYGIDNNSGMMGTRTNCKACHYRPPVLPHTEHGWVSRENEEVISNVLSGFCDGNYMLHEHILNYTREFLRHPHPAKWAAMDLNAGHRKEMESVNQVDEDLAEFLKTVLSENSNLVVFMLGDHGKPYQKNPGHLGGYYETLLPFLSVIMPTWVLEEAPSIMDNLITNQQRYLVPADLHGSMKSLLHFPDLDAVTGTKAPKSVNIFSETIKTHRSCQDAYIPEWSCVCGLMRKLRKSEWSSSHSNIVQLALDDINAKHSQARLVHIEGIHPNTPTSCLDLHLLKILHIFVNENPQEDVWSPQRYIYHITYQTVEMNTVWLVIIDNGLNIKQIKQISMYQKYDVCWDKRVPLPYCVCDMDVSIGHRNKQVR
ncbi:uncharacterized protein [Amphiura filiformis]|uniref:uncharacterized protein n=1 Tax=Amphiura filiformis TaxID=82378 RepID=UPI003B21A3FD